MGDWLDVKELLWLLVMYSMALPLGRFKVPANGKISFSHLDAAL